MKKRIIVHSTSQSENTRTIKGARDDRLKASLRENLKRRKAQMRLKNEGKTRDG